MSSINLTGEERGGKKAPGRSKGGLADEAYDTVEGLVGMPENRSRDPAQSESIGCDYWPYKVRQVVECLFGKPYRRIATRYEKSHQ